MDWTKYPNFHEDEFRCSYSGLCDMDEDFISLLQKIRNELSEPIIINSGYRDKTHPIEAAKKGIGEHQLGMAADIKASGTYALRLITVALNNGVSRIGINQKGLTAEKYIHLGIADKKNKRFPKAIWTY